MNSKKSIFLLFLILTIAFSFRIWGINYYDMGEDPECVYLSARSVGWFDYYNDCQTAPVQWFKHIPGWANLSFHDHPPLPFLIQNIFFRIFSPNIFFARLPFLLANLIVTVVVYLIIKTFKNNNTALFGAFIWAISSFSSFFAKIAIQEGIEVLFISLSILGFLKYLITKNKIFLFFCIMASGLALLSKYTAIFLIFSIFIYLFLNWKTCLNKKDLIVSLLILFLVLSPVIFYNVMVFKTRGHFDAAISSIIGLNPADFGFLQNRHTEFNPISNLFFLNSKFLESNSFFFLFLILTSIIYLALKVLRRKSDELDNFIFINIGLIILMFCFFPPDFRFISILFPFLVVALSCFVGDSYKFLKRKSKLFFYSGQIILVLILGFEIFYNLNTNVFKSPYGFNFWCYSDYKRKNYGLNQLENYLFKEVISPLPHGAKLNLNYFFGVEMKFDKVPIFYLGTPTCVSCFWYSQKYLWYYGYPVIQFNRFLDFIPDNEDPFDYLSQMGVMKFYYVLMPKETVSIVNSVTCQRDIDKIGENIKAFDLIEAKAKNNGKILKEIDNSYFAEPIKIYLVDI